MTILNRIDQHLTLAPVARRCGMAHAIGVAAGFEGTSAQAVGAATR
ncbi:MAG: hypothetical protein ABI886_00750 [Betaproteobacteria bacterium]